MIESATVKPIYTRSLQHIKFVLVVVSVNVFFSLVMAYISHNYFHGIAGKNRMNIDGLFEEFLFVIVFAPFLETLLLQIVPYKIVEFIAIRLKIKASNRNIVFIVFASLLFALMHTYNWLYVVSAFIGGVTLNYSYVYFKNKKFYPYLSVATIHLLYNLSILTMKHLL